MVEMHSFAEFWCKISQIWPSVLLNFDVKFHKMVKIKEIFMKNKKIKNQKKIIEIKLNNL